MIQKILISSTNNNSFGITDSRFIPETLKFNDGSSVVSWFHVDDSGLLSPAYQRFDQFGKKVGESVNLKSINPNSSGADVKIELSQGEKGNGFNINYVNREYPEGELFNIDSTFEVKVVSVQSINGANKFVIDGNTQEKIQLEKNKYYEFDWSNTPTIP